MKPRLTCKKKTYSSRKKAKKARRQMRLQKGWKMTNIYYCEECQGYHMTSMDKRKSRAISRPSS